jgi:hypothetical protein
MGAIDSKHCLSGTDETACIRGRTGNVMLMHNRGNGVLYLLNWLIRELTLMAVEVPKFHDWYDSEEPITIFDYVPTKLSINGSPTKSSVAGRDAQLSRTSCSRPIRIFIAINTREIDFNKVKITQGSQWIAIMLP